MLVILRVMQKLDVKNFRSGLCLLIVYRPWAKVPFSAQLSNPMHYRMPESEPHTSKSNS